MLLPSKDSGRKSSVTTGSGRSQQQRGSNDSVEGKLDSKLRSAASFPHPAAAIKLRRLTRYVLCGIYRHLVARCSGFQSLDSTLSFSTFPPDAKLPYHGQR